MKKKFSVCALAAAMFLAQAASAQDFDDRWYMTVGTGVAQFDNSRSVGEDMFGSVGFGKFFSPNWSIDAEYSHVNPSLRPPNGREWELTSLAVVARYHYIKDGRDTNPFVTFGLGTQRHSDETQYNPPALGFNPSRDGDNLLVIFGAGFQYKLGRTSVRGELGVRVDMDDESLSSEDQFNDVYVSLNWLIPFGTREVPPPPPAPEPMPAPQKTCADLDDDGDGVNNCNDRCPNSTAGQAVGPDGCPVPLTIDLKGVNFDFDKASLRPDAVAILDEAVAILAKYPELKVEVAGHTDAIGADDYNQGLSERRARTVYDYLTAHGIDASRLIGPRGFGESKPIDTNESREGRANNRRTELNVEN